MKLITNKFRSGGLHEKHVVATWNVGNHLSAFAYRHRETEKTCVEMAGRRTFQILTFTQQSGIEIKNSNTHTVQQIHIR